MITESGWQLHRFTGRGMKFVSDALKSRYQARLFPQEAVDNIKWYSAIPAGLESGWKVPCWTAYRLRADLLLPRADPQVVGAAFVLTTTGRTGTRT